MKQIKFIAAALIMVAVASCTKSKNDLPAPVSPSGIQKKLTKATYTTIGYPSDIEKFTYDSQGRLATKTNMDDDVEMVEEFNYTSTTMLIVTRKNKTTGISEQTRECSLNGNGAITKMVFKAASSGTVTYTYEF